MGFRNPWTDFDETLNIYPGRGYANTCKSMWRCDNVGGLGEHVKKHVLWFLRCTFFNFLIFLLYSSARAERAKLSGPILTIYTSYDVFPAKDVPFGGLVHIAPHFGGKIPPKTLILGAWIGIFKLNVQNIKMCIVSKLLRRLQPNFAKSQRPPNTLRGWSQHA